MVKKVRTDKKQVELFKIKRDGESDGEVPVYDTCDIVRKKIKSYLKSSNITRAGFLRANGETHRKKKKISKEFATHLSGALPSSLLLISLLYRSKSLNVFLAKRGANAGNASGIFYAAYLFFEKMRICDGQLKSEFILMIEDIYGGLNRWENNGKSGVSLTRRNAKYFCRAGQQPCLDLYGRVRVL